ncbi:MAG: adenylate kinase [Bacilli bacterium]|nr:adenylate kinase [Bacilli bacterium]
MKNIMFIAPPAAGKGTQAEMITAKYNIPHISTGDILREIAKEDSEIGNYVAETMASGKLVKDEITYQLIEDRLSREDCKNGFIIDGFPRNLDQAIEYDKILAKLGYEIGNVFLLNISTKTLEKRITGRRVCEDCNAIYNINDTAKAPQVESVCDKCGGKLYQRKDDNLESFQTRFAMYQEKTEPIIEHYRKQNVLHEIDSNHEFDEVFRQIDEIISKN